MTQSTDSLVIGCLSLGLDILDLLILFLRLLVYRIIESLELEKNSKIIKSSCDSGIRFKFHWSAYEYKDWSTCWARAQGIPKRKNKQIKPAVSFKKSPHERSTTTKRSWDIAENELPSLQLTRFAQQEQLETEVIYSEVQPNLPGHTPVPIAPIVVIDQFIHFWHPKLLLHLQFGLWIYLDPFHSGVADSLSKTVLKAV